MPQCLMLAIGAVVATLLVAPARALQFAAFPLDPANTMSMPFLTALPPDADDVMAAPYLRYYAPRGDTVQPRMLVMRGCSGSSAIMLYARVLMRMHGIPVPAAYKPVFTNCSGVAPEFWAAEMTTPYKNCFYDEAGQDIGEAMTLANARIQTYNQTLFFQGSLEELAVDPKSQWLNLRTHLKDMKVLAIMAGRRNLLDTVVCQIKDCFNENLGYPVDEFGRRSSLCFERRDDKIIRRESDIAELDTAQSDKAQANDAPNVSTTPVLFQGHYEAARARNAPSEISEWPIGTLVRVRDVDQLRSHNHYSYGTFAELLKLDRWLNSTFRPDLGKYIDSESKYVVVGSISSGLNIVGLATQDGYQFMTSSANLQKVDDAKMALQEAGTTFRMKWVGHFQPGPDFKWGVGGTADEVPDRTLMQCYRDVLADSECNKDYFVYSARGNKDCGCRTSTEAMTNLSRVVSDSKQDCYKLTQAYMQNNLNAIHLHEGMSLWSQQNGTLPSYKAYVSTENITGALVREENLYTSAKTHLEEAGIPYLETSAEDLLEFETDIPGALERGVEAWGKFLYSLGIKPEYPVIRDFLTNFANTYEREKPHRDIIYNSQEVKETLVKDGYGDLWRD